MSPATFTTAESVGAAGATWGQKIKDRVQGGGGLAAREALEKSRRPAPAKVRATCYIPTKFDVLPTEEGRRVKYEREVLRSLSACPHIPNVLLMYRFARQSRMG